MNGIFIRKLYEWRLGFGVFKRHITKCQIILWLKMMVEIWRKMLTMVQCNFEMYNVYAYGILSQLIHSC